ALAHFVAEFLPVDEVLHGPRHRAVRVQDEMMEDVDTHLIGEFERTHRESRAEPHRRVNRLDRNAFPLVNPCGLFEVRSETPRRDKAGDVLLYHDDRLAV